MLLPHMNEEINRDRVRFTESKTLSFYNNLQSNYGSEFELNVVRRYLSYIVRDTTSLMLLLRKVYGMKHFEEKYQLTAAKANSKFVMAKIKSVIENSTPKTLTQHEIVDSLLSDTIAMSYGLFERFLDKGISIYDEVSAVIELLQATDLGTPSA